MATHPSSPAPGAAEFSLIPQGDFAAKPPIRIVKPIVLVGSDEHCHLHLVSSSVSRHHALIIRDDDRIYICDLGSRTKILVNGKEQRDAELSDGDSVRIGKFSFKFSATRPAAKKAKRAGAARLIVDGQAVPTPEGARLILIGRTSGSDITLVEESVSARHAVIFEVAGKRYVRDLDSRTGTFLNGKKTHQHEIRLEDDLRVGETTLKLTEPAEEIAEAVVAPAAAGEEPLPIADEVAPAAVAVDEEPIPLAVEPVEAAETEAVAEPAMPVAQVPVAQLPLEDPLPFSEPLPVDLEPESAAHEEIELALKPVAAVDHSEEPLELEPEFPSDDAKDIAPETTQQFEHGEHEAPLKFEPETTPEMEDVALAALAPSGDANEDTHIDLEAVTAEAERETAEPPAPVVQATIPANIPVEPAEVEVSHELDLSDAPEAEPASESQVAHPAAEPEPVEPPVPVMQATIPADVTPVVPEVEVEADAAIDFSDAPHLATVAETEIKSAAIEIEPEVIEPAVPVEREATAVELEAEPAIDLSDAPEPESTSETEMAHPADEAEREPVEAPAPIVRATIPADVAPVVPEVEADVAIDLSDAPHLETAAETEIKSAAIEVEPEVVGPAVPVETEAGAVELEPGIDLSDAPAPRLAEQTEAGTPAAVRSSELDLLAEFAAKPAEEFKPVDFETDLPIEEGLEAAQSVADEAPIDVSDEPSPRQIEPEPAMAEEAVEAAAGSSAAIDLSDAQSPGESEPEPAEPTPTSSETTIDLSDAPSLLDVEPVAVSEPELTEPELTEPVAAAPAETDSRFDEPVIPGIELEEPRPVAQEISLTDSSAAVDVDSEQTEAESEPEISPINFDSAPAVDEAVNESPAAAAEVPVEPESRKTSRGRKRQTSVEPKTPKARRSRAKRVPPKPEDEEANQVVEATAPAAMEAPLVESSAREAPVVESSSIEDSPVVESPVVESPVVESSVTESVEIESLVVEAAPVEEPELAVDLGVDLPADSSVSVSEAISTEGTLTAPGDAIPAEEINAEVPVEEPSGVEDLSVVEESSAAEEPSAVEELSASQEPSVAPAPPPPAKPFMSVGDFAYLTGGTVNLDHSLGGMPVRLPDLPPAPTGFGQVRVNLSGKASSPFSSFAKSEPLVFDEPDEISAPLSSQPKEFAQPESIVAEPVVPPPAPVEAQLETVVTPAPAPHDPPPKITTTPPPAPAPAAPQQADPQQGAAKAASPVPPGPRLFATSRREGPVKGERRPRPAPETFSQPFNAFDGLAPAVREADAFSNIDAVPLNDAAFGGARLSRSDDHNVPESPEAAARLAQGPEYDFAEDDFWNRTDEDEGAPAASTPAARAISPDRAEPPKRSPARERAPQAKRVAPAPPPEPVETVAPPEPPAPAPVEPVLIPEPPATTEEFAPLELPEITEDMEPPVVAESAAENPDEAENHDEVVPAIDLEPEIPEEPVEAIAPIAMESIGMEEIAAEALGPDATSPETFTEDAFSSDALLSDTAGPEELPADSGEASAPADNLSMESLATTASHSDDASEPPAPPPPRKRRRFRIPFLMPLLLLAMALGLGAIWRFTPVHSQVVGKITFDNYNWTAGTHDGTEFEASQRRLLDSDRTHHNAVEFLHRDHPDVSPGFLQVPDSMGRVVSSFSLISNRNASPAQTVLQVSYSGRSKDDDRLRMMALLQSVVDANAPILDSNHRLHDAEQQAQQNVEAAQKKKDLIQAQLAELQATIDAAPSADQMAKLTAQRAQLEKARDDAEEAVNRDNNELASAKVAAPEAITAAATMPADPADSQLKQMRQQIADLSAELDSAHSDQLAAATLARQHLETTAKQFNDQLATADEVLGSSSQLRQFVTSARDSQAKARELINILIVDGEDLEKQLEDTRRDVEDLIQARQELKWADDPQLQQFRENLESAQHRYNANVGDGNKDPRVLDPLQKEIDKWTITVKAREQQLGVDSSEIKVEEGLNNLVESLRSKLQREKQLVGQILDPLEKQLNDLNPVVAGMPAAEQDLAKQLRLRLDALNDARRKYAEAVGEGQVAPSVKVTDLQKQIADLKDKVDRREKDLSQQKAKSSGAAHVQNLGKLTAALDADQKKLDEARSAYGQIVLVFDEKQAEHRAAEVAQKKKIDLFDAQVTAGRELEASKRDRDEKQAAAEHAFDIRPITDGDVIASAASDPRMMYSLLVLGAGVVLLAGLTFMSHSAAHRAHQLGASGHHHKPPPIAEQIDSMVLPMASDPPSGE